MTSTVLLEERYITEYIRDILSDLKIGSEIISNAKYHHNTSYEDAPSVCTHGILSMQDLKTQGIKNYSEEILRKMGDIESHINGNDRVSLAVVGLQDLYPDEDEYDPFCPSKVDFLVSSDVRTGRSSLHYGNEFLAFGSIGIDKLRSVDIRLLHLIDILEKRYTSDTHSVQSIIEKYNYLQKIALALKQAELDIPFREMSSQDNMRMDIDRLSTNPQLALKKQ